MDQKMLELAEQIRTRNIVEPVFPEDYLAYGKQEDVEKCVVDTREGPVDIYIHRAKVRSNPCPLFYNIHGGGFVRPLIATNIHFCSKLAVSIQGVVVDVDYSLAPEYQYPVALHQCYDVAKWIFDHARQLGTRPELISMGGHSAGANMTAAIMLMVNQTREFRPCLQILDFGAFDMSTDAAEKPGLQGNLIPLDRMRAFNLLYTNNDPAITQDPYVSPLLAPDQWLKDQPDCVLITGGTDMFRFEGERYGLRLIENGTKVTMRRFEDSPHGFTVNCNGKWLESQQMIIDAVRATALIPPTVR